MSLSTTAYVNIGVAVLSMTIALLGSIYYDKPQLPSQNPRSRDSNASPESADGSSRTKSLNDPILDLHVR
ncbi:ddf92e93-e2b3-462b-bd1d-6be5d714b402 [Sclerotinia trifoliorum]|uniref:Ddf92e93-e2b3-462b-bd1d-6be5d714b402 n=1 Tax=Sclerotinia trifoliorum TaxID=28548 RepID=A0A8H2VYK9_9HELO|nr:ddf92e93-e2b3-462b-bd1d-6be5d714b402 [Sclerotinia trifoliorum]